MKYNKQQLDAINRAFNLAVNNAWKEKQAAMAKKNEAKIAKLEGEIKKTHEHCIALTNLHSTASERIRNEHNLARAALDNEHYKKRDEMNTAYEAKQNALRETHRRDLDNANKKLRDTDKQFHDLSGRNIRPDSGPVWSELEMELIFAENVTDLNTLIAKAVAKAFKENK